MRVPVVVSDTKIDRYYFNDSVVQFFCGEDEKDLARSLLLVIKDSDRRKSLVDAALEFVQHNDWDMMKPKYLALVDSLLKMPDRMGKPKVVAPIVASHFPKLRFLLLILSGCAALVFLAEKLRLLHRYR